MALSRPAARAAHTNRKKETTMSKKNHKKSKKPVQPSTPEPVVRDAREDLLDRKKAAILGTDRRFPKVWIIGAVLLVLASSAVTAMVMKSGGEKAPAASAGEARTVSAAVAVQVPAPAKAEASPTPAAVAAAGDPAPPADPAPGATVAVVSHPASLFEDGRAQYFEYTDNGKAIRYFVVKSTDGVIRAAFDACDVCWAADLGYSQDGGFMVCNNCGQRFESTQVNEVEGGCNPSPLARRVENGQVILQVQDILAGAKYFNQGKA